MGQLLTLILLYLATDKSVESPFTATHNLALKICSGTAGGGDSGQGEGGGGGGEQDGGVSGVGGPTPAHRTVEQGQQELRPDRCHSGKFF